MLLPLALVLAIAPLTVRIVDENDQPTPARVYLTDPQGAPVPPPANTIVFDKTDDTFREVHFVPPAGTFSLALAPGNYRLTVERGKEYLPHTESITVPHARPVTVQLQRWVDMKRRGWISADMHVHRPLADLATLMASEDLSVAIPITRWRTQHEPSEDPSLGQFLTGAGADGVQHGPNGFFPILNEELESHASALLASFLGRGGVPLAYPLWRFAQLARVAGGLVDSEKPTSLELPALAALDEVDFVGLANNHLWRQGFYAKPWGAWPDRMPQPSPDTCEGFVRSGWELFDTLMNAGLPVRLSAGTASGVQPVPPGWSRIYVRSHLDPASWRQSLLTGDTFVTTGPMLFLQAAGQKVSVEMLSLQPVAAVELVVDGEPRSLPLTKVAGNTYQGSTELKLAQTSWVAARWLASAPSGGCSTAHTSALWIPVDKHPFRPSPKAKQQLQTRVRDLLTRVEKNEVSGTVVTDTDAVRRQTLNYITSALGHLSR